MEFHSTKILPLKMQKKEVFWKTPFRGLQSGRSRSMFPSQVAGKIIFYRQGEVK